MAITIEWNEYWPTSQALRVAVREQGAGFANLIETRVDLAAGQQSTFSPFRELPGMRDSAPPNAPELMLGGPLAITTYLASTLAVPAVFLPNTPDGLPVQLQWAEWSLKNVAEHMEVVLLNGRIRPPAQRQLLPMIVAAQNIRAALRFLEPVVPAPGGFLRNYGGQTAFSYADILLASSLTYIRLFPAALNILLSNFPRTAAYLGSIEQRPAFTQVFAGVTLQGPGTTPGPGPALEMPPP